MQQKQPVTAAQVTAWATMLLGFGLIQGTIYLKSYWRPFGIDPFQFSSASDLALVGLTGVGVTVALMVVAALVGGYLATVATPLMEAHRWLPWTAALALASSMVCLVLLVDFGWHLVMGMLLTWFLIWLAHRSADIPLAIKNWGLLPYIALALAYIPIASHYYGQRAAQKIIATPTRWQVDVAKSAGLSGMSPSTRFAGRLGTDYIFYEATEKSVSIVPSTSVARIVLRRADPATP